MYRSAGGWFVVLILAQLGAWPLTANAGAQEIGAFQGQADVGSVTPKGTAAYDIANGRYTLRSAGAKLGRDGLELPQPDKDRLETRARLSERGCRRELALARRFDLAGERRETLVQPFDCRYQRAALLAR